MLRVTLFPNKKPRNLALRYQHTMQKMASQIIFSCVAIAVLLAASSANADDHAAYKFSYTGADGLAHWGEMCPDCMKGKHQSPINVLRKDVVHNKKLTPLIRDYKPTNATLVNNGFVIGVTFDDQVGTLVIDGKNYTLKQMHWHSPAEHQIDGIKFAAELHLVHLAEDKKGHAVVSILYQLGAPDPLISKLNKNLDELAKDKRDKNEEAHIPLGIWDNKLVRKNTHKYYRYVGSLTTPPCSEEVIWNILGKVRSISNEQVAALKAPLNETCKYNARPPQPLNGRKIELFNEHVN